MTNTSLEELLRVTQLVLDGAQLAGAVRDRLRRRLEDSTPKWRDDNWTQLAQILEECIQAMNQLQNSLLDAGKQLRRLAEGVRAYEDVRLGPGGFGSSEGAWNETVEEVGPVLRKTEEEKLQDLRRGLAMIDIQMENWEESLRNRGMDAPMALEMVISQLRCAAEAEFLRNMNGDFSQPFLPPDPDDIIRRWRAAGSPGEQGAPARQTRSLQHTAYGFEKHEINGRTVEVYDDPAAAWQLLIRRQGNSAYPIEGDCGLCQCANQLTLAGYAGADENYILSAALRSSDPMLRNLDLFDRDPGNRGGTAPEDRRALLSSLGLKTHYLPIHADRALTIRQLASEVSGGYGVILSVDVRYLWRNGQTGGHAISLLSVSRDGQTFYYSDTGNGVMGEISASNLARALTGRPANVTDAVIR